MKNIKTNLIGIFTLIVVASFTSCGASGSSSGSGYRSVNHYHHGMGAWGSPYYGNDVIIIDDGIDIGMPDGGAVNLPADDWD